MGKQHHRRAFGLKRKCVKCMNEGFLESRLKLDDQKYKHTAEV